MILALLRTSSKSSGRPSIASPTSLRKATTATWKVVRSRQNAEVVLPGPGYLAENLLVTSARGLLYWSVLTALVVASLVAARRVHARA
ncbi:hypothetical protein HCN51_46770 [Nonomuraea sp. FMUSA5-5]|uniref:Uncharacterized protein n=1 Tax=Nonomuraea composti TaxID=2720023 RepID=A0ABX1BGI4_9ACTN|nr:hypothetical protein [Nonomuraea sp. FMUSA5-5]NJP96850.1 hypothetical protein [Nonomuraea sp. FMUSA5-5]